MLGSKVRSRGSGNAEFRAEDLKLKRTWEERWEERQPGHWRGRWARRWQRAGPESRLSAEQAEQTAGAPGTGLSGAGECLPVCP